ncbi:MAG: DUF1840 domain-containing protein [Burkholderiaceae bacterium]
MPLVVFRSRAAGEIYMFAESAARIFAILGRAETPRGVITVDQVPDALQRLSAAVDLEKAETRAAESAADSRERAIDDPARPQGVTLAQRAFPLLEMLRAAEKKKVDVTWGV